MDDKEQFIESFEVDNIEEESNKTQKKKVANFQPLILF